MWVLRWVELVVAPGEAQGGEQVRGRAGVIRASGSDLGQGCGITSGGVEHPVVADRVGGQGHQAAGSPALASMRG